MTMSKQVRDVFVLAGLIALYGVALWLYESKLAQEWGATFANEPRAIFNRGERERLIEEEMATEPSEATEASDGTE